VVEVQVQIKEQEVVVMEQLTQVVVVVEVLYQVLQVVKVEQVVQELLY